MNEPENQNDLIKARFDHLHALKDAGINPFVADVTRTHTSVEARDLWKAHASVWNDGPGTPSSKAEVITVVGRIRALRTHGGATFIDLEDGYGKLQSLCQSTVLKDQYELIQLLDLGDFLQVSGRLFETKRGELTVHAESLRLLTKSLYPLPDKWSGLEDTETRYRERYADLIANPEVRERFKIRSKIVKQIRQDLENENFMEVETPVLQTLAGGATAKPFITHYNAYDTEVYLRVAPELHHKRLIVGGFERVYEFARVFRNEGVDHTHSPEFTDLEFYAAYWNYEQLMEFTEKIVRNAVKAAHDKLMITYGKHEIDFEPEFTRVSYQDAVKNATKIDIFAETEDSLRDHLRARHIDAPDSADFGKLCDYLFKAAVKPTLTQPTFLIDHPIELSPLAKRKDERTVERFQLCVAGEFELCNAFSELNDPIDQKMRFEGQVKLKDRGDDESQPYDADFIHALEYGMPPTAGFGMGIDRLAALLTDSHTLREVILFPYMRPKEKS